MPRLSVVMPLHNGEPYLNESIGSIVSQTFSDWELVILENGSTDGSFELAAEWAERDRRIRLHRAEAVLGGAASMRRVIELSSADLIARMDADDVSHPDRLRRQMDTFGAFPDAALVATLHTYLDASGRVVRGRDRWPLLSHKEEMPFSGACQMFRRDDYDQVGGFEERAQMWGDVDLYRRLSIAGKVMVVPDALYGVRFHADSMTNSRNLEARVSRTRARWRSRDDRGAELARGWSHSSGATFEVASMQLWSGVRPSVLWPLVRHGFTASPRIALALTAWSALAWASPETLRTVLRLRSACRDRAAGMRIGDAPVAWSG